MSRLKPSISFLSRHAYEGVVGLGVDADVLAVEEIPEQDARVDVTAMLLDEVEDGSDTSAAVQWIVDIREDDVKLVGHGGLSR